jgi:NADPH-dependent 2,4-dienoyl-CoA reductase/sulfur reductase-like enzyme
MTVDLAVIGAGPAGMAAAVLAAELGLATVLIDEQASPGGQIYKGIERFRPNSPFRLDYAVGRSLVTALRASSVAYRPGTTLWHIDPDGILYLERDGRTETVTARRVMLATGALERPVPIPGWTLPGVMTVGAAQTLLKSSDVVPEGRTVLAGQGPLLYLAAAQLACAGAPPIAVLETTPEENYVAAAGRPGGLWPGRRMLFKGLHLVLAVKRAGIPIRRRINRLRALGQMRLERVVWEGGELAADHLFLHEGVTPNVQISLALRLRHRWDEGQLCWRPVLDSWGQTSFPNIAIAGDGGGIAGAEAAALSGRLAALDAAKQLGHIGETERDSRSVPIRAALDCELALRPFLDRLYQPPRSALVPIDDETIACRCEEVSVGQIRGAARLGAPGPNQLKAFTRCGMGPCQGRMCGPIVSAVIADTLRKPIADIGTYRPRAPFKPITLGALADVDLRRDEQELAEALSVAATHPPADGGPSLSAQAPPAGKVGVRGD